HLIAPVQGRRALPRGSPRGAGLSPGRLTRWSLHLPPATGGARAGRLCYQLLAPPAARLGITRSRPATEGFPEFTRFASAPWRAGAPFCQRNPPLYPAELRAQLSNGV